jgi:iron complex transport system ATP-binding protein
MRLLGELGFEVTAGVLHASDTDEEVAAGRNLLRVSVPPFSDIDERSAEECLALMRAAEVVVVADAPFGRGNVANLRLALEAARSGVRVVLVEGIPMAERDFTGGEASRLWSELGRSGEVVGSPEELAPLVR